MLLKVVKITPSSNGGQIVTLSEVKESKEIKTALGVQKQSDFGETFYTKVSETELQPGAEVNVNLEDYNHVFKPFTTENNTDINLHWLFLK